MSNLPNQIKEQKLHLLTLKENLGIENANLNDLLIEVEREVQSNKAASNEDKRKVYRHDLIQTNEEILALQETIANMENAIVRQKISIEFLENEFKLLLHSPHS